MSWARCRRVAWEDAAHGASVKSVAAGHWPSGGGGGGAESTAKMASEDEVPTFTSAGLDGVARVWRLEGVCSGGGGSDGGAGSAPAKLTPRLKCVAVLEGHGAGVRAVAMTGHDRDLPPPPNASRPRARVATASYDRTVRQGPTRRSFASYFQLPLLSSRSRTPKPRKSSHLKMLTTED
jgi:WD40 repeat protein